jgi:hypothetical protein
VSHIFLSYARKDVTTINRLVAKLETNGYRVWVDREDLTGGERWRERIADAIKQADAFLLFLSPAAIVSENVSKEIDLAIDNHKRIIPIEIESVIGRQSRIDYEIAGLQRIDLTEDVDSRFPGVLKTLLKLNHERAASAVIEPDKGLASDGAMVDGVTAFIGQTVRGSRMPTLITSLADFESQFGEPLDPKQTYLALAVRGFFENGGERAYVARVLPGDAAYAAVRIPLSDAQDAVIIQAVDPGMWGNRILINVRAGSRVGFRISIHLADEGWPDSREVEDFDNLSDSPNASNYWLRIINERSHLVSAALEAGNPEVRPPMLMWRLMGGAEGPCSLKDFIRLLADPADNSEPTVTWPNDIGLICIPDLTGPFFDDVEQATLTKSLIDHCERNQCFAILGTANLQTVDDVPVAADNPSAAMYFPWIVVRDFTGRSVQIPSVGHVAGAYARHDRDRGVNVSPLNIDLRGLSQDVDVCGLTVKASSAEIDALRRKGVNVLTPNAANDAVLTRTAITMAVDEAAQQIGANRFLKYLDRSIVAGTSWVIFEINNESMRTRVREHVEEFLTRLWRLGVLWGETTAEAFSVDCDTDFSERLLLEVKLTLKATDPQFLGRPTYMTRVYSLPINLT